MTPEAGGLRRAPPLPVETLLFDSPVLRIGRFHCPPHHPLFPDSGPIENAIFVFPRAPVWIQHEGGPPFVADPTVATLYNQGQRYRRRPVRAGEDRCDWFALAPRLLRELAAARDGHAPEGNAIFIGSRVPVDGATYIRQRALVEALHRDRAEVLWVEEQALWLAARVLARDSRSAASRPVVSGRTARLHRDQAEHARTILNARYAEPLSLVVLASLANLSVFHLARVFRAHAGMTLHAYRQALRLRAAVERLNDPGAGITEVALALGFSSHSHFTAAFRQTFGITPSAFRRAGAGACTAPDCIDAHLSKERSPRRNGDSGDGLVDSGDPRRPGLGRRPGGAVAVHGRQRAPDSPHAAPPRSR